MGDLILLCVAAEELGIDKSDFRWVIETRSAPWARHLGLDHVCYDEALLGTHWRAAGRYPLVINTEQRFGLSQATALAARAGGGRVVSFDTNVASAWSDEVVRYDPFEAHESVEFGRLLAAALRLQKPVVVRPRRRRVPPTDRPVVGLPGPWYTRTVWTEDEARRVVRKYGVAYIVFFPDLFDLSAPDLANQTFFRDLKQGRVPPWLEPAFSSASVRLYQVNASGA